mgnify:CR=1 FL=1
MKLLSTMSTALQAAIDVTTKVFTKTVPSVGEAVFHTTSMANDTVRTSRFAMLIENAAEIRRIKEDNNLTDKEIADIESQLEY